MEVLAFVGAGVGNSFAFDFFIHKLSGQLACLPVHGSTSEADASKFFRPSTPPPLLPEPLVNLPVEYLCN